MTTATFNQIAKSKLQKFTAEELKTEARKLVNDFRDEIDMVLDVTLEVLMEKMEEKEYIEFCNSL